MAFEKKEWVNVPDPKNYTGDTPLSELPRFDADNMNRIEEGISNALPITGGDVSGDVGARTFKQMSIAYGIPVEIGQYLDMHKEGSTTDYDLRIFVDYDNNLRIMKWGEAGKALYGEHNKPTAADVGAIAKTTQLKNKDILDIAEDGIYYITPVVPAENVPTTVTSGYARVMAVDKKYRVVYWRPHNSTTEYVNVLDGGKWLGWTEIFTDKGGTFTGHSIFLKNGYARVGGGDGYAQIDAFNSIETQANRRKLTLNSSMAAPNLKEAITLTDTINNTGYGYNIFGEHNKPTGTYGGGEAKQINVGGIGRVLLITSDHRDIAFVDSTGARSLSIAGGSWVNKGAMDLNFTNGVLTLSKDDYASGLNVGGYTYYYQVL